MATINQFQQYSQGENVTTNNILLMLSLLYEISPKYYNEFISGLIEDTNFYSIVPEFRQQVGNMGNGIMDGHIVMKRSSIIIETKLQGLEIVDKLIKYTDSFKNDDAKLVFHLSLDNYNDNEIELIQNRIDEKHPGMGIKFHSITYNDMVNQLSALYNSYTYDAQLRRLFEQFQEYCRNSNLLLQKNVLRAMACGQSHELNVKHQFYFDLASRGYSKFNFLGIYFWKAVRYIGRIENVIVANYDYVTNTLDVIEKQSEVTALQEQRLIAAILDADKLGWGISENHRFFLLKDFHETRFEKSSPGGIFRVRYFNLEDYLGKSIPENTFEIAELLKGRIWEI